MVYLFLLLILKRFRVIILIVVFSICGIMSIDASENRLNMIAPNILQRYSFKVNQFPIANNAVTIPDRKNTEDVTRDLLKKFISLDGKCRRLEMIGNFEQYGQALKDMHQLLEESSDSDEVSLSRCPCKCIIL